MGRRSISSSSGVNRKIKPAETLEGRENQLISLAYNLVEQRLIDGTATSQETTHFLKLGSVKTQLEIEKIKNENELLIAKAEAIQSAKRVEELYSKAISAMRLYNGLTDEDDDD